MGEHQRLALGRRPPLGKNLPLSKLRNLYDAQLRAQVPEKQLFARLFKLLTELSDVSFISDIAFAANVT
jgi:hypothetical protein